MNPFIPHLFIAVGEKGCFFTLRQTYLHTVCIQGETYSEVRDFHHFNLSQDPDEAIEKAREAAERLGLELRATREALVDALNDIQRATAAELARRERDREEREARWIAERVERDMQKRAMIVSGRFPFGDDEGKPFQEVSRGYLTWLMDKVGDFDEGSLMRFLAEQVTLQVPELALPKPDKDLALGEPKQRLTLNVEVIKRAYFNRDCFSGYGEETVWIITMIDKATNACLVSKSVSFFATPGDELTIKGTVKEHSEYNGQAQTVLQRIKVIDEKAAA